MPLERLSIPWREAAEVIYTNTQRLRAGLSAHAASRLFVVARRRKEISPACKPWECVSSSRAQPRRGGRRPISRLLVAGNRFGFRGVVALLSVPGDLSRIFRRIHFDRNFAVGPIELRIGGGVTDRVMIAQIVSNMFYQLFHFVDILGKERLPACDLRKFLQVFLRFF